MDITKTPSIREAAIELIIEELLVIGRGYRVTRNHSDHSLHIGDYQHYFIHINFGDEHVRMRYIDHGSWVYAEAIFVSPDFASTIMSLVQQSISTFRGRLS